MIQNFDTLYKILPNEIVNHHILPYCPSFNLSKEKLSIQRKRLFIHKTIRRIFLIDDVPEIKHYVFNNYMGERDFYFEGEHYFIFISHHNFRLNDYLCVYF